MDKLTEQWLQAIAYDDFHEDRFGLPDKNKKIKVSEGEQCKQSKSSGQ